MESAQAAETNGTIIIIYKLFLPAMAHSSEVGWLSVHPPSSIASALTNGCANLLLHSKDTIPSTRWDYTVPSWTSIGFLNYFWEMIEEGSILLFDVLLHAKIAVVSILSCIFSSNVLELFPNSCPAWYTVRHGVNCRTWKDFTSHLQIYMNSGT